MADWVKILYYWLNLFVSLIFFNLFYKSSLFGRRLVKLSLSFSEFLAYRHYISKFYLSDFIFFIWSYKGSRPSEASSWHFFILKLSYSWYLAIYSILSWSFLECYFLISAFSMFFIITYKHYSYNPISLFILMLKF